MKTILIWLGSVVLGALIGGLSALWMAGLLPGSPRLGGSVEIEGWVSDWSIGSEAANPYVRARIARHGLLALRKEEAVYFTRAHDDDGERLREGCEYQVVYRGYFPAEWWSITLYDDESRLPLNNDNALSFDRSQAVALFGKPLTGWIIRVSEAPPRSDRPEGWISNNGAGHFTLTIRLYRPEPGLLESPEKEFIPPIISRNSCDGIPQ